MRVWVVVMVAAILYLPWVVDQKSFLGLDVTKHMLLNMDMTQFNTTLILLVGALGLNLVTGYTGMISIGNAGFFALGAIVASRHGPEVVAPAVPRRDPALRHRGRLRRRARRPAGAADQGDLPPPRDPRLPLPDDLPLPQVPGEVVRLRRRRLLAAGLDRSASRSTPRSAGTTSCSASPPSASSSRRTSCARGRGARSSPSATTRSPPPTAGINVARTRITSFCRLVRS